MEYNHLGIDEICSLLQDVISIEKQLYELFSDGMEIRMLAMDPEQMSDVFCRFYGSYRECSDKLNILEQKIRDGGSFFVDQKKKVLLENEIILFKSRYEIVLNLYQAVCHAYKEYETSRSSGNPGDVSELLQWQCIFCEKYYILAENERLLYALREIQGAETSVSMVCVYAAPDKMDASPIVEIPDVDYPLNHSVVSQNGGNAIPVSEIFCPQCGMNIRESADTTTPMGNVYASPDMMWAIPKREKRFSFTKLKKIFKGRKKHE